MDMTTTQNHDPHNLDLWRMADAGDIGAQEALADMDAQRPACGHQSSVVWGETGRPVYPDGCHLPFGHADEHAYGEKDCVDGCYGKGRAHTLDCVTG